MSESGLVWKSPPLSTYGKGSDKFVAIRQELTANPGEWAQMPESLLGRSTRSAYQLAANINRGLGLWGPKGMYEGKARAGDVCVRYVGHLRT